MKTLKVKFHSFIDLITNSSTEMFADYSNSVEPLKAMINEMFKVCGVEKTCDEVFVIELDNEDDECFPATLNIRVIDNKYDNLLVLIDKFIHSVETKEFMN